MIKKTAIKNQCRTGNEKVPHKTRVFTADHIHFKVQTLKLDTPEEVAASSSRTYWGADKSLA